MISDDDLLLYHYGDGLTSAEQGNIASLLATDPALRARLKNLVASIDSATPSLVTVPHDVQQRWRAKLDSVASAEQRTTLKPTWAFSWRIGIASAAVVTLALAIGIPSLLKNDQPEAPSAANTAVIAEPTRPVDAARFERSLRWYLTETEQQLASLQQLRVDERASVLEKALLQNRLYAVAAERVDEPRYARALRGFAPVLERISDDDAGPDEFEAGLAQLSFELKIMQARLDANSKQAKILKPVLPI
jgi:hypothetical protein